MNNDIKKYLKEVNLIIPIHSKEKKEFSTMLQQRISNSHLNSYEEITKEFGQPTEIAASFLSEMDANVIIKELTKKKIKKIISIIIIIIIFILAVFKLYYLNNLYHQVKNNQPVQVEEIIEE